MENTPLQVGDLVKFKSGGPLMTISKIDRQENTGVIGSADNVTYTCKWYSEQTHIFAEAVFTEPEIQLF